MIYYKFSRYMPIISWHTNHYIHMAANRALIADDHVIVRAGLKTLIRDMCPFFQQDEAVNGAQVMDLIRKNDYDILILDVNMPDTDAIALVSDIFACKEKSRIMMFSMNSESLYAKRYLKLGVLGYLEKDSEAEQIRLAISTVLAGNVFMSESLKRIFVGEMLKDRKENPFERLSNREIQIAKYMLQGYTHSQIQKALNLHSSTVGTHKTRSFEKLNVRNVFELRELANLYRIDLSNI
jgi:two-component system invasion response regulator UvrY